MQGPDAWACVELLAATAQLPALEGYEFVRSCEEVAAPEPTAVLVPSPLSAHGGRAMLAVCDGARQLAIAKWILPTTHRAACECAAWRSRARSGGGGDAEPGDVASRVLLLLNGHCYSAWHARKRLVLVGCLALADELALSALVLRRFASAPDAWAHRRWLLARSAPSPPAPMPASPYDFDSELLRCDTAAATKRANYYAGMQREWLLSRLAPAPAAAGKTRASQDSENAAFQLAADLMRTEALLRAHPSDSSVQYARQASVLASLRAQASDQPGRSSASRESGRVRLAACELEFARQLLRTFAGDTPLASTQASAGSSLGGRPQPHAVLIAHHRFAASLCLRLVGAHGLGAASALGDSGARVTTEAGGFAGVVYSWRAAPARLVELAAAAVRLREGSFARQYVPAAAC